jgi:hypothetical protein
MTSAEDIYFGTGVFASERPVPVALLTSVRIDGMLCSVQIDTGLNSAIRWHADQPTAPDGMIEVELGNMHRSVPTNAAARELTKACGIGNPVASLGNGFFDTGTLEIDFSGRKLTYSTGSALPPGSASGRFRYAKWGTEGGHVLVEAKAPQRLPREALLDTGSLQIDLMVHDRMSWRTLTKSSRKNPKRFAIAAWGRQHQCLNQQSTVAVGHDGMRSFFPSVTFCPTLEFQPVEPILGTIGMRRYLNGSITIDYPSQMWRGTTTAK